MTDPARIIAAAASAPYRLQLTFQNGFSAEVDLESVLNTRRGLLAELLDPTLFMQVRADADAGTVVWPNGVDLDPDVLYEMAHTPMRG